MNSKIKTKLIILATLIIAIAIITIVFSKAAECPDSGTIKTISYSPSNLSVGIPFNLTYSDAFNNGNSVSPDILLYPAGLTILAGNNPADLIDDGLGGGYYVWRLNSSANGTYTVIVTALYESTQCNVTRNITIGTPAAPPNIVLNYSTIPAFITSKQSSPITLLIKNNGVGTAYNVTGTTTLTAEGVIDTFSYATIISGDAQIRNFNINTDYCGIQLLSSTANYKDSAGYSYPPSHADANISVRGSDLVIESFTLSDNNVKVGENVRFNVTVTNNNRNTSINATNAVVRIYRGNSIIGTISLGTIAVGETKSGSIIWKAAGAGTFFPIAVVDSDQECSNWNNSFVASSALTIRSSTGGGGGGGGGGYHPVCGNGICEWGEIDSCPQDCKIYGNETKNETKELETEKCGVLKEDLIEISDDGMASLKIYEGTEIKINGKCIGPGDVISLRAAPIPYPMQNFYLVRSYNFLPEGLTFDKEAEIKIKYHKGEIRGNAFIVAFNPEERRWVVLGSIDNKEKQEVTAKITHFSTFALVTTEPPRLTGAVMWNNITTWTKGNWWVILIVLAIAAIITIIIKLIKK
ncbi:MAG: CARDB domain-containing protein [Candidatus Pacearchaeota archaeon]